MSFGKKKTQLPRRTKRTSVWAPPRKISVPDSQFKRNIETEPDLDSYVTVSMKDIGMLAAGVCETHGYPDDFLPYVSHLNIWLSQRGFPALSLMSQHIWKQMQKDVSQLGPYAGPLGELIAPCPLIFSSLIGTYIDQLIAAGPEKKINFFSEGPSFLLLPRLSDHAERHNVSLMVVLSSHKDPNAKPRSFLLHKGMLSLYPKTDSDLRPSEVIIRVVPPEYIPTNIKECTLEPEVYSQEIQCALIELINQGRIAKGLAEIQLSPIPLPKPNGIAPLKPETRRFFRQVIYSDPYLYGLFQQLSKADKSILETIIFGKSPDKDDLSNTAIVTTNGSNNDSFYKRCLSIGWMEMAQIETGTEYGLKTYQITKTGLKGLSVLLTR